jgi:hypothetical protein
VALGIPPSYFCSKDHLRDNWDEHKKLHEDAKQAALMLKDAEQAALILEEVKVAVDQKEKTLSLLENDVKGLSNPATWDADATRSISRTCSSVARSVDALDKLLARMDALQRCSVEAKVKRKELVDRIQALNKDRGEPLKRKAVELLVQVKRSLEEGFSASHSRRYEEKA